MPSFSGQGWGLAQPGIHGTPADWGRMQLYKIPPPPVASATSNPPPRLQNSAAATPEPVHMSAGTGPRAASQSQRLAPAQLPLRSAEPVRGGGRQGFVPPAASPPAASSSVPPPAVARQQAAAPAQAPLPPTSASLPSPVPAQQQAGALPQVGTSGASAHPPALGGNEQSFSDALSRLDCLQGPGRRRPAPTPEAPSAPVPEPPDAGRPSPPAAGIAAAGGPAAPLPPPGAVQGEAPPPAKRPRGEAGAPRAFEPTEPGAAQPVAAAECQSALGLELDDDAAELLGT